MVAPLRPEPDARSVIQPQASAFWLPGGDLQPLTSPDPLNPLVIDQPAGPAKQRGDLAIAVAAILPGQLDDIVPQPASSSRPRGILRCVERCCPSAAQARRSEIDSVPRICSMQARRRAGLSSFPVPPPAGSPCPGSGRKPRDEDGCSPPPDPSDALPDRSSIRRTPGASGNTLLRSPRSSGLPRQRSDLARSAFCVGAVCVFPSNIEKIAAIKCKFMQHLS